MLRVSQIDDYLLLISRSRVGKKKGRSTQRDESAAVKATAKILKTHKQI